MYKSVTFSLTPPDSKFREILIALLDADDFEGICEEESSIIAYIPADLLDQGKLKTMEESLHHMGCELTWEVETIEDQNWNSVWEKNFEPVVIDQRCAIRAPFHPHYPDVRFEITIEPKMSFGTGHHQTTRLIIEEMFEMDFEGKTVLDMGCGTGVLAILSAMLGAVTIYAIDVDDWAYKNALENVQLNDCHAIQVLQGSADVIPDKQFDIILANINRNILLEQIPTYARHLADSGILVLSGILTEDETIIRQAAAETGLLFSSSRSLEKWMMLIFQMN